MFDFTAGPLRRTLTSFLLGYLLLAAPQAEANVIGDFFKKIGRSISNLHKPSQPPANKKTSHSTRSSTARATPTPNGSATPAPSFLLSPTPSPTPIEVRRARLAPAPPNGHRDVPYALAVPNKPGLVTSPYAPQQGYVDVSAFPSSTEVIDPFTGKIFLTP